MSLQETIKPGAVFYTNRETYTPKIVIVSTSSERVLYDCVVHEGLNSRQGMTIEEFVKLLSDGEYTTAVEDPTGNKKEPEPVLKLSNKPEQVHEDTGKKYERTIYSRKPGPDGKHQSIVIDVYCAIEAFGPMPSPRSHAAKKILCAGLRGKADAERDIMEAITALERDLEILRCREGRTKPAETAQPEQEKIKVIVGDPDEEFSLPTVDAFMAFPMPVTVVSRAHEFRVRRTTSGFGLRKTPIIAPVCIHCEIQYEDFLKNPHVCPKLNSP